MKREGRASGRVWLGGAAIARIDALLRQARQKWSTDTQAVSTMMGNDTGLAGAFVWRGRNFPAEQQARQVSTCTGKGGHNLFGLWPFVLYLKGMGSDLRRWCRC